MALAENRQDVIEPPLKDEDTSQVFDELDEDEEPKFYTPETIEVDQTFLEQLRQSIDEEQWKGWVDKKVAWFKSKLPGLPETLYKLVAEQDAEDELEVLGHIEILGMSRMEMRGEHPEVMREWKQQVEHVLEGMLSARISGDFSKLIESLEDKFSEVDLKKIFAKIEAEAAEAGLEVDEETDKLTAIGLWMWNKQGGEWPGTRQVYLRVYTQKSAKISDFLEKEEAGSCVDMAFLAKAMAQQFGIQGDVKRVDREGTIERLGVTRLHHYFETDSKKVLDYWWSRGTAGVKPTHETWQEKCDRGGRENQEPDEHGCVEE